MGELSSQKERRRNGRNKLTILNDERFKEEMWWWSP
jgi:hypothetical protein